MTSKLKCPVCGAGEVLEFPDGTFACDSEYCKSYEETDTTTYDLLIQSLKDLEIATKAFEKLNCEYDNCRDEEFEGEDIDWEWWAMAAKNVVETALKQIEHKE